MTVMPLVRIERVKRSADYFPRRAPDEGAVFAGRVRVHDGHPGLTAGMIAALT